MAYCRRYLRIQKLIRLPRKQKKALKKSLLQDIFTIDRNYLKECPKPKKSQYLVINKNRKDIIYLINRYETDSRRSGVRLCY